MNDSAEKDRAPPPPPAERRPPTLLEAIVPIASLIFLVALSYYLFKDAGAEGPNQVGMVLATLIAVFMGWRNGYTLEELGEAGIASVGSGIDAIFILFAVGALIGTWAMSGTLVTMVFYGLKILSPGFFYVTAAALAAGISYGIGSSWTLVGTVGIGLMGVSTAMGLNPAVTAGAIISGAYFGDTTSPISDSANLAAGVAEANLYAHLRQVSTISLIALAIALVVFGIADGRGSVDRLHELAALDRDFHVSLVLFLPLAVVMGLAIWKFPPFTTIILGALVGGVMAIIVAPERVAAFADAGKTLPTWLALIKGVWQSLADGYVSKTGDAMVDTLTTRGGMSSMLPTVWLVISAFAFGGVVEKTGALERIIRPIVNLAKTPGSLIAALVVSVFATNVATADQYLAVVLPGRMFRQIFKDRDLPPTLLSRSVGASATPTSALVPWNSCGAYMAATLGIATFSYLPYAVFNFASPVLTIAAAYLLSAARKRS